MSYRLSAAMLRLDKIEAKRNRNHGPIDPLARAARLAAMYYAGHPRVTQLLNQLQARAIA